MKDSQLLEAAVAYKELGQRIEQLTERRSRLKDKINREFERRGTKAIEGELDGAKVRVTHVQRTRTVYMVEQLKARLSPKLFAQATKPVVVKEALLDLVARNKVKVEDVDACAKVEPEAAYPMVTIK